MQTGVFYRLVAQHSGKAADIDSRSTAAGARLIQWSVNSGTNQQFEFVASGGEYYRVKARHSGLVLEAADSASGSDITQQPDTDATSQQWRPVRQAGGTFSFVNRRSGLAMDVWEVSTADGARISQWAPSGGDNQRFALQGV
ncbi:RICIN domain-containing protein [Glycomyces salinus]|uniref:RICIN domain-containing protein n=1 Tax=Glycomyces salinus TaxID=980294 RepID=UPI003FD7AC6A